MRVRVTKFDLAHGTRCHEQQCAVAMALQRLGFGKVEVLPCYGTIETADGRVFTFSQEVTDKLIHWDDGGKVRPFVFEAKEEKDPGSMVKVEREETPT